MPDRIHVIPDELRTAAEHHRQRAEYLATIPSSHDQIQASLDSLGPIYGELAEAGRRLLDERRRCYEDQAADHAEMAQHLTTVAALWEQHEQDAAAAFRALTDDHR